MNLVEVAGLPSVAVHGANLILKRATPGIGEEEISFFVKAEVVRAIDMFALILEDKVGFFPLRG
jgi:hypothetical protein